MLSLVCHRRAIPGGRKISLLLGILLKEASSSDNISILTKVSTFKFNKVRIGNLSSIYSYAFLSSGLASLAKTYISSSGQLNYTNSSEWFVQQKQDDCWPRGNSSSLTITLNVCLLWPNFLCGKPFSTLTEENISQLDYENCQAVWNACNCWTLADYLLAYLRVHVDLLADIQDFRLDFLQKFDLDPSHFVSLPQQVCQFPKNFQSEY